MTTWTNLMESVARRHEVVARTELLAVGLSPGQIDRLGASGRLVITGVGVYRVAGAPDSFESRVLGAILGTEGEAWASHRTAARLWGIRVPGPERPVDLTRPYGLSANRGGVWVHRSTHLPEHHLTTMRAIPVTTAARTLFDLARSTGLRQHDRAVDYIPTASELEAVGRAVLVPCPRSNGRSRFRTSTDTSGRSTAWCDPFARSSSSTANGSMGSRATSHLMRHPTPGSSPPATSCFVSGGWT